MEIKEENADVKGVLYNLPDGRKRITGYSLLKVLNQAGIGDEGWTRVFIVTSSGDDRRPRRRGVLRREIAGLRVASER